MSAPVPPRLWYKPGAHVVFADGQLADGPHGLVCYTRADIAADRSAAQVAAARTEALREALALAEKLANDLGEAWKDTHELIDQGRSMGAEDAAAAIRALIPESKP